MRDSRTPLVVFLHGPFGRPADFDGVADRIPNRFPVRAPLLPFGRTGAGSLVELTDRLEAELGGETSPLVLVGGSDGGRVALAFARRHAERVRGVLLSGCPVCPECERDALGDVRTPVLLLWGTEDRVTPPDVGRRLLGLLPDARLLFIIEAGHAPMVDRPSVFAFHLSSFLNDLAPLSLPPRRLVEEAA